MNLTLRLLLGFLLVAPIPAATSQMAPSKTPIHDYTVQASSVNIALQQIARDHKVVIGLNAGGLAYANKQVSLFMKEGVLADALNAVTAQEPQYSWRERSGVIEFQAKEGALTLPDVQVARFTVKKMHSRQIEVSEIPEVKKWMEENRCPHRDFFFLAGAQTDSGPEISVDLTHVTFGQVLDALAMQSGSYSWAVNTYQSNGRCYSSIVF